ncbi:bifunctional riboflavin kinase/FAD synthetase [Candidatus Omnitrophota bacterium]
MKRIYTLYKIPRVAASIGIFDGVHRGHQKILRRLVKEAKKKNLKSLVITFHPHPRKVLNPGSNIPFLTSLEHRSDLIKGLGVDLFLVIKFTKSLSRIKPDDFIRQVLIRRLNIKTLVVGENFLFGHKEKGDLRLLKRMAGECDFRLVHVGPLKIRKEYVSSTRIRHAIERGDLRQASSMLGRPVTVFGTVVKGRRLGRRLGFPTANINPHHEAIPPSGVYAVDVKMRKKNYKGILNIGMRPTFGKDNAETLELHILDFKNDIYGKDIEIIFKRKIRNERRFSSSDALRVQIRSDILKAR